MKNIYRAIKKMMDEYEKQMMEVNLSGNYVCQPGCLAYDLFY